MGFEAQNMFNTRVVVTLMLLLAVAIGAHAAPPLHWTPQAVNAKVAQGQPIARPLPVTVAVQATGSDGDVDADSNGVWDYIDRYIDTTYGSASAAEKAALRQFSRAIQGALLDSADLSLSLKHAMESDRAMECLFSLRPADAPRLLKDVRAAILNTRARSRAFLMWSEQSAGQVFHSKPMSKWGSSCISQ
jgi:hypothetical protein